MRARYPEREGFVERDGIQVHFEVYGAGEPTLFLIPPSPITHSRIWKGLIPHLARHYRVVTIDGRGNGRSGRPGEPDAHSQEGNLGDLVAVLDATETPSAVVVAHCHANWWAVALATAHPERVEALVAIEPGVPYLGRPQPHWVETAPHWDEVLDDPKRWELNNRHAYVTRHRDWVEFFFGEQLVEAHSTKQLEDAIAWALESSGEVLAAGEEGFEIGFPDRETVEDMCRSLNLPTLTIHGELDVCQHVERGREFARITGGDLLVLEGAGHLTPAREPVEVNRAIRHFVDELKGVSMPGQSWARGMSRRKKALFLSSPIGLGHARRDLSVAQELRKIEPDLEIEWLAQHPVTTVLADAGETIHPASEWLASESGHIASEAAGHELHCFQALRRMDEILVANFMVFQEVVEEGHYDLVIGDEAWDVDYYWHENPELKRGSNVWLTDFVGYLPMPDGGDHEAFLTADYNAEMIEHIARFPRIRDRAIFVGNPDDIYPAVFGPDLPKIRDWTEDHFAFSGYITGFDAPAPGQVEEWRHDLGYDSEEKVCIVTVGGSGVGRALLEKVIAAYPLAKELVPELRMVAVAGPRIEPESLPAHPGLEVRGYVGDLYRHLAVSDLAVVQGGLTTTMELTAAQRPFLYFPLINHFEQNFHVRHRLDQYGAGRPMDYRSTDPDLLAEAITSEVGREVRYRDVETDGAERAARMISELV
jgi:pimeloyl-ACP methyl ester carboxylesterase/predicted glycosyltransferase